MEVVQCRACPSKGSNCLGYIEIGSHCSVCRVCRGNKACTVASPSHLCNAKMLKLQAEVKVNVATGSSAKVTPGKKAGTTRPVSKRTRSKALAMLNDQQEVKQPDNDLARNNDDSSS